MTDYPLLYISQTSVIPVSRRESIITTTYLLTYCFGWLDVMYATERGETRD